MDPRTFPVIFLVCSVVWTGVGCGDSGGTGTESNSGGPPATSSSGDAPPTSGVTIDVTVTGPAMSTSGAEGGGGGGDGSGGGEPSSTGAPAAQCGDGLVEGAEECDNGFKNADDSPCTTHCKQAVCGDGLLLNVDCLEVCPGCEDDCKDCGNDCENCEILCNGCENKCEHCDPGAEADGCTAACEVPDTLCGNGEIDGDEECDAPEDDSPDPDKAPCLHCKFGEVRRVFVSSALFTGAIDADHDGDALEEADAACQALAAAVDLPRAEHFRAWLSRDWKGPGDISNSPDKRFLRKLDVGWRYILRDGTIIADDYEDLVDIAKGPKHSINKDEHGFTIDDDTQVWTGTSNQGLDVASNCSDWSMATGNGTIGRIGPGTLNWSQYPGPKLSCSNARPIYCFEDEVPAP